MGKRPDEAAKPIDAHWHTVDLILRRLQAAREIQDLDLIYHNALKLVNATKPKTERRPRRRRFVECTLPNGEKWRVPAEWLDGEE